MRKRKTRLNLILNKLLTTLYGFKTQLNSPTISELILDCWIKMNLETHNLYTERQIKKSQKYDMYSHECTKKEFSDPINQGVKLIDINYSVFNSGSYYGTKDQMYQITNWIKKANLSKNTNQYKEGVTESYDRQKLCVTLTEALFYISFIRFFLVPSKENDKNQLAKFRQSCNTQR